MGIPVFDTLNLVLFLAIAVLVMLLVREVLLWYFRIPESIKNQKRTIELLEKIAANQEDILNASQTTQVQPIQNHPPQTP